MKQPEPIKININNPYDSNNTLTLTLSPESTIDEMTDAFKVILSFLGYHQDTINEVFNDFVPKNDSEDEDSCDCSYTYDPEFDTLIKKKYICD